IRAMGARGALGEGALEALGDIGGTIASAEAEAEATKKKAQAAIVVAGEKVAKGAAAVATAAAAVKGAGEEVVQADADVSSADAAIAAAGRESAAAVRKQFVAHMQAVRDLGNEVVANGLNSKANIDAYVPKALKSAEEIFAVDPVRALKQ